ncbi:heme-binding protein [Candidatus Bathyarchaeota archaeon]|nr:heme-binding protein [Candidatus Bathyarchaeota archaeon]
MVETAEYEVIRSDGAFEIRRYEAMMVATVKEAPSRFSVLFKYISGANRSKSKIAMTSPVITSKEISMTSPVISDAESMSFMVPSEYDAETVPEPVDERITINAVPERFIATFRFRGLAWKESVRKQTERLLSKLESEGIKIRGEPFLMQYNPPFVPGFLRRNEVGVEIEYP